MDPRTRVRRVSQDQEIPESANFGSFLHTTQLWRQCPNRGFAAVQLVRQKSRTTRYGTDNCSDPSGPTFLTYTPNGKRLVTAGTNNVVRVYETGSDGEPTNVDDCQDNNLAVAATVSAKRR